MKKCCLLFGLVLGLIQISCTEENDVSYQLKTTSITLISGKTHQIEVLPAISGWSFSSKNSNIASVSDSGLVTTHYVGTTKVYVRHEAGQFVDSVQVTVNPNNTFFEDPFLGFFVSELTVSKNETGSLTNSFADARHDGESFVVYKRESHYEINYHFNIDGLFDRAEIFLSPLYELETLEHLTERYIYLGMKDYSTWVLKDYFVHDHMLHYVDRHYISPDSSKLICMCFESTTYELKVEFRPFTTQAMDAILNDTIEKVYDH
jgi:hypothetical protein